ncbi:hypothetical protein [Fodinicola acaciae]|uniref:hypothetical protein n=1 Tax=Fodinicola acaciae TaxID=2681555 RepID=UPI00165294BB|nr:hypothetical protein [Fodinicola acaciae]
MPGRRGHTRGRERRAAEDVQFQAKLAAEIGRLFARLSGRAHHRHRRPRRHPRPRPPASG